MVRFIFLPLWRPSKQKTRRQGSRSPCRCGTCGVVYGLAPVVRCPKPWLLRWANIPLRSTRATSLRPLSDTSWTWGVQCTFQSPPVIIWSTSFLKKMAENVVSWISSQRCNAATWSPWIFNSVLASMQVHGKNCMVPNGSTWRRQISISAWQREMVERWCWRFSCFLRRFVKFGSGEICEVVVGVGVDWGGFKMECIPGLSRLPNILSRDWFWQNTAGASAHTRKEQMAPQICLRRWATRGCWKSWIFTVVPRSLQQRGKNCMVPSGSTWRRRLSACALQREMVEGCWRFSCFLRVFICLYWVLLKFRSMMRFLELSYESELTETGY